MTDGIRSFGPGSGISTSPGDGEVLVWNDTISQWVPSPAPSGGGSDPTLYRLVDDFDYGSFDLNYQVDAPGSTEEYVKDV